MAYGMQIVHALDVENIVGPGNTVGSHWEGLEERVGESRLGLDFGRYMGKIEIDRMSFLAVLFCGRAIKLMTLALGCTLSWTWNEHLSR